MSYKARMIFMKVILLQKVSGLGNIDEIREVADGYARNFLFPRHLAVQASPQALQDRAAHHKKQAKEAERDLHEQEQLAGKLDGFEIELAERANEQGILYAAVTPHKVAAALTSRGLPVHNQQIEMKPIKELGNFSAMVKLRHGLEAEIAVIVSAQKVKK